VTAALRNNHGVVRHATQQRHTRCAECKLVCGSLHLSAVAPRRTSSPPASYPYRCPSTSTGTGIHAAKTQSSRPPISLTQ